jgi:hypothetical protein
MEPQEMIDQLRRVLSDAAKVIRTLEVENQDLKRRIAEMESAPR